ncbi:MAG: pantoate--beta-alanine ligase [Solirubrobacterales bacterium]
MGHTTLPPVAFVGRGRVGGSLSRAAEDAGLRATLAGRDDAVAAAREAEVALICVPDEAIPGAAAAIAEAIPPLRFVGHTSGATGLGALAAATEPGARTFSLHPLQTIPDGATDLAGVPCAVAGSDPEAEELARRLAERLGMLPFAVADEHRAAYHAAASIASNFLVTLESSAAGLLDAAGVERPVDLLAPLVLRTAANWSERGAAALTGPIARGDERTVARHLDALREHAPELLPLYDVLAARTRELAGDRERRARNGSDPVVVRTKAEIREALASPRRAGLRIGLVPTMGALHEGHLSLLRAARERCDVVVMSLFVNPAQFGPGEDLEAYPRDESRDLELAAAEGVELVYAPGADEVYPAGFATTVEVGGGITDVLDGDPARRGPEHFRGVTTVVAKLFNSVGPDIAFFGQKDAQQAVAIRRMVRDLDFPVEIAVEPTVRDPDGLALSSRNAYLDPDERDRAAALHRALRAAERAAANGASSTAEALATAREELTAAGIEPEYLEARDAEDLTPADGFNGRPVLVAVAARVGRARLIDNLVIGLKARDEPEA